MHHTRLSPTAPPGPKPHTKDNQRQRDDSQTFKPLEGLLDARRDYELEPQLRRMDRSQVIILDDPRYVQQCREEMEVLFTSAWAFPVLADVHF